MVLRCRHRVARQPTHPYLSDGELPEVGEGGECAEYGIRAAGDGHVRACEMQWRHLAGDQIFRRGARRCCRWSYRKHARRRRGSAVQPGLRDVTTKIRTTPFYPQLIITPAADIP